MQTYRCLQQLQGQQKNTWVSANIPEKNRVGRQNFSFSKFVPR